MKKIQLVIGIVIVAIVLVGVGAYLLVVSPPSELKKINMGFDWILYSQYTPWMVAENNGWFEEAGYDVEFTPGSGGTLACQTLGLGKVDLCAIASPAALIARSEGIPIKCVALFERNVYAVTTLDPDIETLEDLEGKRVGVQPTSTAYVFWQALAAELGIEVEEVPYGWDPVAPFEAGQVDALMGYSHYSMDLVRSGYTDPKIFWLKDYGIEAYTEGLYVRDDFLEENPDIVRDFVRISLEGYHYAYEHPEEAIDVLLKFSPESDREIELGRHEWYGDYHVYWDDLGGMTAEGWQTNHDFLYEYGFITNPIENINTFFTTEFLP